jgi:ribonuclease E
MKQEMLINVSQPEECRIAIVEDGVLEELYIERTSADNYVGNIYKGRVVNIEPSIQAAFVDFGVGRNGFLHISDVEPQYFRQGGYDPEQPFGFDARQPRRDEPQRSEAAAQPAEGGAAVAEDDDFDEDGPRTPRGRRGPRFGARPRIKPPIQDILRRGDELLVQVIKEGIGTKGPTLSTYISIPGRYLVLMPALGRVGVSRKIEDDEARRKLRDIMLELNPPRGLGFIVRTAGVDRTKKEISRDLAYLLRLWKVITRRIKKTAAPVTIYEESDMIIRTIRDIFTGEVDSIFIDEPSAYERAKEFLQIVMPRYVSRLQLYNGREPLFHKYDIESEIAKIQQRKVPLKQGGSIVIDQTEALVAIDVNSGNFRADDSAEETAYQMNQLAAKEIARQLRLRDLGGVIVNDFIDMRKERHRRNVERALREAMKRDRARTKILRTSPFGLIEMTRQRIRPSLKRSVYKDCPCCTGTGVVKTAESMAIEVIRMLQFAAQREGVARVSVTVAKDVADYLHNKKRREIAHLEDQGKMTIQVYGKEEAAPEPKATTGATTGRSQTTDASSRSRASPGTWSRTTTTASATSSSTTCWRCRPPHGGPTTAPASPARTASRPSRRARTRCSAPRSRSTPATPRARGRSPSCCSACSRPRSRRGPAARCWSTRCWTSSCRSLRAAPRSRARCRATRRSTESLCSARSSRATRGRRTGSRSRPDSS